MCCTPDTLLTLNERTSILKFFLSSAFFVLLLRSLLCRAVLGHALPTSASKRTSYDDSCPARVAPRTRDSPLAGSGSFLLAGTSRTVASGHVLVRLEHLPHRFASAAHRAVRERQIRCPHLCRRQGPRARQEGARRGRRTIAR